MHSTVHLMLRDSVQTGVLYSLRHKQCEGTVHEQERSTSHGNGMKCEGTACAQYCTFLSMLD